MAPEIENWFYPGSQLCKYCLRQKSKSKVWLVWEPKLEGRKEPKIRYFTPEMVKVINLKLAIGDEIFVSDGGENFWSWGDLDLWGDWEKFQGCFGNKWDLLEEPTPDGS